jgi:signal transduction histidine kinase
VADETSVPSEGAEDDGGGAQDLPIARAMDPPGQTSPFLDRLSEAERQALAAKANKRQYAAGAVVCREGDPGDVLYVIESGRVAVVKEARDSRPALLGYRGPGESLGEMSLVSQQPRFASLVAVEDTSLLCLDAATLPALMGEHPGIGWAILNVLNDRLRASDVARTTILQEEQDLTRQLKRLVDEAERLAGLSRTRQETIELIVHDLQTPLTVIDGSLELLRGMLPEEVLAKTGRVLDLIENSSGRLRSLVEELLAAARQEASAVTPSRLPVDLDRLLRGIVERSLDTARQSDIALRLEAPSGLPRPLGDAAQLERVVSNLLDNALSYTPEGGRIVVAVEQKADVVEVGVTDSGPGVPPEHRDHIFERFTRVPGIQGRRPGFGLGLYFCRQAVQAHGGRIWVEPGPGGVGSRFAFTLPIQREG